MYAKYKGRKVFVERRFKVGDKWYADVSVLGTNNVLKSIPVENLNKSKKELEKKFVIFQDVVTGKKKVFEEGSEKYSDFVTKNGLKEKFIENCLKGLTKTHKGYKIYYKQSQY